MTDRIEEIRARLNAWHKDPQATTLDLYFSPADIEWLLGEVKQLRAVVRKTPDHYRADARAVRDGLRYDRV